MQKIGKRDFLFLDRQQTCRFRGIFTAARRFIRRDVAGARISDISGIFYREVF